MPSCSVYVKPELQLLQFIVDLSYK